LTVAVKVAVQHRLAARVAATTSVAITAAVAVMSSSQHGAPRPAVAERLQPAAVISRATWMTTSRSENVSRSHVLKIKSGVRKSAPDFLYFLQ
jgi:hypothetical protein